MRSHLVAYEYGTGAAWGYIMAPTAADVAAELPDVHVVDEPPAWMTREDLDSLREHATIALYEATVDKILECKKAEAGVR